jgi:hypothetical protein
MLSTPKLITDPHDEQQQSADKNLSYQSKIQPFDELQLALEEVTSLTNRLLSYAHSNRARQIDNSQMRSKKNFLIANAVFSSNLLPNFNILCESD